MILALAFAFAAIAAFASIAVSFHPERVVEVAAEEDFVIKKGS